MYIIKVSKYACRLTCLLLISLVVNNLSAQLRHFDKIPTQEGDVNLSVRQVMQDKQGKLWLATFSGLYRFEGDDYILQHEFTGKEKINSDVTALLEDSKNNIWIGTNDGLSKYNPEFEELTTYRNNSNQLNSIGSNKIRSLAMDQKGRIWIGTSDQGLFLYNSTDDYFASVDFEGYTPIAPKYIKTILIDEKDKIWIGTLENGVYCFTFNSEGVNSVQNFREETDSLSLSDNHVYELFKDADGTIVVGTRNGLNIYNSERNQFEDVSTEFILPGSLANYFRSVIRSRDGKLWIGTWGGLILCDSFQDIETGNYQLIRHNRNVANSISHNQIMDVFHDKSGMIWLATENGLNRFDPYYNQFQPLSGEVIDNLGEPTATDFCPYRNGMLILTLSDGLIQEQNNQLKSFIQRQTPEFKNEKFYSLCVDSKQNVWVGSQNGLLIKIHGTTKAISTYHHSMENIPIFSIVELDKNILAIGTFGDGLKYFNTKSGKFSTDRGLSTTIQINDIHVDNNKCLWVATQLGIFKKENENESFEYFLPDNQDSILKPNIFIDIAESDDGKIYVGGRNGLYIYNAPTNSFSNITLESQKKLWVTNLQFDSKQNLWLNLNFNLVAKWDISKNKLYTYNVNNGIRSNSYNRRGFYIDTNDRIFISGFDQIFEFNAASPVKNDYSPTPIFTKLLINNTEIHPGVKLNDQQILNRNISFAHEIKLNHLNKDFTISFRTASFLNYRENQYRYILQGYDNNWRVGKEGSASYTNLSPGRYTFKVYSANNDGIWSTEPALLSIHIKSAPLLSKLAFLLYILIFVVISYFVRSVIVTRIRLKRELLVEKVKRDKEEKFNQERLRFYTNISHELRTPLTLIMGPIKELVSDDKPNSTNSKLHQLILNNSQRLLSLVNQLLDFRKSLHQGMKLKVTKTNLVEIIESNIAAFAYMADEKQMNVDFKTSEQKLNGWYDIEKLDIVFFNILSNAFKYTPESGFISLELSTSKATDDIPFDYAKISVSNTGKGISKHLQEKVFERFFQVKENKGKTNINTGTGIGLALVKNLVELHHGNIKLESEPGKSTTITLILPINREEYSDEEIFDFSRDADRRTKELIKTVDLRNEDSVYEKQNAERKKILIVEDNLELRDYLAGFLSPEYKVFTATDGLEGLKCCKDKYPDLVISDVMMENMDGLQFCATLKSTPEISHIPVILITALASVENKLEGYKTGADDYITKPFEPELLRIRIRNIFKNLHKLKTEFGHNEKVTSKELTTSKIDEEFLNKVIDLVEKNLDNADFDIDEFSKTIGVSSSQLYRKIKGITGVSPNEFIRTYRLREAAKLIIETNLTMSEIAYKVGFNDSLYFSKCFKKQFGVAPSMYGKE